MSSCVILVFLKAVEGIVGWRTNTLDVDNNPNKAGQAYIQLYQQEWRSSQDLAVSQSAAAASFSGFRGDYTVRVIGQDDVEINSIKFTLDEDISFKCVNNGLDCTKM